MNPAQAMGTFLRVWRAEWAGLSREQVAIAVSALAPKAKVTKYVVREWEQGQPPYSTAELEALLSVMQRQGITEWEADDFRSAVFAACSSQRYPELFPEESVAYRNDVDELGQPEPPNGVIARVAALREVEEAVLGGREHRVGRQQARRQQVGLVRLRRAVSWHHRHAERYAAAAGMAETTADLIAAFLGPQGLGGVYSALGQRAWAAEAWAEQAALGGQMEAACQAVRLLLRLHHGARGTVQHDIATAALAAALSYCWVLPKEEGAGLIRHAKHWLVASADQHTARDWSCGHTGLVIALSRAGRPADAERLAAVLAAATCDGDHNELLGKAWAAGERALSIGESEGARRHFEALLALGRCRGMATVVRMALDGLGRCEGIEARIRVSIAK